MEILFLGTSSGTPTKTRNVSGVAVRKANAKKWYLVDCGEGTQHQILNTNLALNKLEMIFITHVHGDHCYGLPGLLASASMSGRTEPLTVVAPKEIKDFFLITQKSTQLRLSYELDFVHPNDVAKNINDSEFDIEFVELSHRVESFAYVFSEKGIQRKLNVLKLRNEGIESGPNWGAIQKGENVLLPDGRSINAIDYLLDAREARKIIISGDNDTPDLLSHASETANVLVHEATYTEDVLLKVGKGPQHSSAKKVCQFAETAAIKNLVLTHFSPRYQDTQLNGSSIKEIEIEAKEYYSGNLFLANDFDRYFLDSTGKLSK